MARSEERRACESPVSFAELHTPLAIAIGEPPYVPASLAKTYLSRPIAALQAFYSNMVQHC